MDITGIELIDDSGKSKYLSADFGDIDNDGMISISMDYEHIKIGQDQAIQLVQHLKKQFNLIGH